jgi:hypothetical protein
MYENKDEQAWHGYEEFLEWRKRNEK